MASYTSHSIYQHHLLCPTGLPDVTRLEVSKLGSSQHPIKPSEQSGLHFTDNIFKHIFLNENFRILIKISLKFVPKYPIENKSALFHVMDCHLFGAKPLPGPILIQFTNIYI